MKAIVYENYGGPDVLHVEDVEKPTPAKDQVLIDVRAVEATKADCEMRSFKFAVRWFWLPLRIALGLRKPRKPILGSYFAGVVEAVDSGIKETMLRDIGADHFVDYAKEDFTNSGTSYDVIFSMVAQASYSSCVRTLKPGGRYVMANPKLSDMLRSPLTSRFGDKKVYFAFAGEREEELLELKRMIEAGEIAATVDKIFPMAEAAQAHTRVETEQRLGTVVISAGA